MAESDTRSAQAGAVCAAIARARGYDFVAMYDVLPSEIAVAGWHGEAARVPTLRPRERACAVPPWQPASPNW
jgi:hypothetical protein